MSKKTTSGVKQRYLDEVNALMPAARAGELSPEFRIDGRGAMVFRGRDHVVATIAMLYAQLEKSYDGEGDAN